jgi:hypothetical protein
MGFLRLFEIYDQLLPRIQATAVDDVFLISTLQSVKPARLRLAAISSPMIAVVSSVAVLERG